jgi:hypothetical protein
VLVFRAQRLTGRVAFVFAAARFCVRLPVVLAPPRFAQLAPAPPADMSETKNGPEYASFFAVMGASCAMIFSGGLPGRRGPGRGAPRRRGAPSRSSPGAGRDVTLTQSPAVGVPGLTTADGGRARGRRGPLRA